MRAATRHTLTAAFLVLAARPAAAAGQHAMLLPVDGPGLPPPMLDEIAARLREALQASGLDLESAESTSELISDAYAGGLSCKYTEPACAARYGAVASVPVVFVASVSSGTTMTAKLARVDVGRARVIEIAVGTFALSDKGSGLRAIAERAVHPPATLELNVTPANADVFVDDVPAGKAPLPPIAVTAGDHDVRASLDGFSPDDKRASVVAGARADVVLRLAASTTAMPTTTTPATTTTTPATTTPTTTGPVEAGAHPGSPLVIAGTTTLVVGGLAGAVCGIGVATTESDLSHDVRDPQYQSKRVGGFVWIGGAVAGGLVAAVGGTLLGLGLAE